MLSTILNQCRLALAIIGVMTFAASGHAAEITSSATPETAKSASGSGWTFTATPYFWAAEMSGDIAQFGMPRTTHVNSKFKDILEHFDFATMVVGEARYDRFSIFGDIIYSRLSASSNTPWDAVEKVDVTTQTFSGLLGAGYSVLQSGPNRLDVVGGARIWSVKTEIDLQGNTIDDINVSDSATWVDGIVGLRGRYFLNDTFYLSNWAFIGKGGARLDWDVAATLGYRFNDTWSALAGYRALGVDYHHGDFVFDVVQKGPILGLVVRF